MTKDELKNYKENKDIKFIYKIPCSLYKEGFEYIIIGNLLTEKKENIRFFNLDDWFVRMKSGSLLPYVCSTLSKSGKIKEFLNIYDKPNLLNLRSFLLHATEDIEIIQEGLWGLQVLKEFKVNRPDVFKSKYTSDEVLRLFLSAVDPMYKMSLDTH